MSKCKNCCKEFKYQWCLDRHLRRKIPCKEKMSNGTLYSQNSPSDGPNNPPDAQNSQFSAQNNPSDTQNNPPDTQNNPPNTHNSSLICIYCSDVFSRQTNLIRHKLTCKEKDDAVRSLEIQLDIPHKKAATNNACRFCYKEFSQKGHCTRHIKSCKSKQKYRETLEAKLKDTKQQPSITNNNQTNNQTINNINVVNISAETLKKFGEESTDHITNSYLRHMMGRLGVTIPKVVSNVARKIYCDDSKPENKTIQITNVRSQWAKVSNGDDYELQPLGDTVKGVRNRVTDLYVERLCDDFEYFKKVTARIDRLDDLNNQNYTARTLEDKEDQKNASKLRSEIDRDIKSMIYNVQKTGNKLTSH